jgi:hypothetical protein
MQLFVEFEEGKASNLLVTIDIFKITNYVPNADLLCTHLLRHSSAILAINLNQLDRAKTQWALDKMGLVESLEFVFPNKLLEGNRLPILLLTEGINHHFNTHIEQYLFNEFVLKDILSYVSTSFGKIVHNGNEIQLFNSQNNRVKNTLVHEFERYQNFSFANFSTVHFNENVDAVHVFAKTSNILRFIEPYMGLAYPLY